MATQQPDIAQVAESMFNALHRSVQRAMGGLTVRQVYWRPTPNANSIGWLAWHLSRWKDRFSANVSGQTEVWVQEGWASMFGIEPGRTGFGDTPEQVGAFRVNMSLLTGYLEVAHHVTMTRLMGLKAEQWAALYEYVPGAPRMPVWEAAVRVMRDAGEHTGQIAYLSGIVREEGWRPEQVLR